MVNRSKDEKNKEHLEGGSYHHHHRPVSKVFAILLYWIAPFYC